MTKQPTTLTADEIHMFVIDPYHTVCSKREALDACWSDIGPRVDAGHPILVDGEPVIFHRGAYLAAAMRFLG